MNTGSHENNIAIQRKARHLEICTESEKYSIESHLRTGFEELSLVHNALPEIAFDTIDTSLIWNGYPIALPVFISCMTGGSDSGFAANRALAEAAQRWRIPVGLGSMRVLLEHPDVLTHFRMKHLAPDVPVMANLGIVQLRDTPLETLIEKVRSIEADILVIHINPAQEMVQPEGDRDFRGLLDAFASFCEKAPFPVIAKETGFGIRPSLVKRLLKDGAAYVDIAGAGGSNWMLVESYRHENGESFRNDFQNWGIPTALNLAALNPETHGKIIASGGIRTASDIAKSLCLGATLAGMALPLIRAYQKNPNDGLDEFFTVLQRNLKTIMTLTGTRTLDELRKTPVIKSPGFLSQMTQFKET